MTEVALKIEGAPVCIETTVWKHEDGKIYRCWNVLVKRASQVNASFYRQLDRIAPRLVFTEPRGKTKQGDIFATAAVSRKIFRVIYFPGASIEHNYPNLPPFIEVYLGKFVGRPIGVRGGEEGVIWNGAKWVKESNYKGWIGVGKKVGVGIGKKRKREDGEDVACVPKWKRKRLAWLDAYDPQNGKGRVFPNLVR